MNTYSTDVVIFGSGIAGLWLNAALRKQGYQTLLLESNAIGGGQTIASQGILHSGLKYAFAGKVNQLAKSISAMPDRWRACLKGDGELDLTKVHVNAHSQILMIPKGMMGGLIKLVTKKTLGDGVREIPPEDWPEDIKHNGFKGQLVYMDEPVLDVPTVLRALAEPFKHTIRRIDPQSVSIKGQDIHIGDDIIIQAKHVIFTAAQSNEKQASAQGHTHGLKTQKRPLLMGMMRPAPFPLYAHVVGTSDKPVATITTHTDKHGDLVWYLGGQVAERATDAAIADMIQFAKKGLAKALPHIDLSNVQWAAHPINRIEGKSDTESWMPDTPVVHSAGNTHYCWPTKLTFAPMLADKILQKLSSSDTGQGESHTDNWDFLPEAPYAAAIWDDKDDEWI